MTQGSAKPDKLNTSEASVAEFTPPYPFRHKNYVVALNAIQTTLENQNAVILQGAERTGKSTLIAEIRQNYQQQGVEVISFTSAVNTPRQLYCLLADALKVPKLKKHLVAALQKSKKSGEYCLVILDEAAVNSSAATSEAMRKLCDPKSKTAGAIKVIVVCTDYLVIHTKTTYETDFHDWIETIVPLETLKTTDLESLTRYLAELKRCPAPQFEVGTDIDLIQRSSGKIDQLIHLINPLIDDSVISRSHLQTPDEHVHPLDSKRSKYYFVTAACVLVLFIGLGMRALIVPSALTHAGDSINDSSDAPIFSSETTDGLDKAKQVAIKPPVSGLKKAPKVPEPEPMPEVKTEPVSTPAMIPKPMVPTPIEDNADEEAVAQIPVMIDAWLQAWRSHNPELYFGFYHENFTPPKKPLKRWRDDVRNMFKNEKWLQLKRDELDIELLEPNQAKLEFWITQMTSKGAHSRIKKRLMLISNQKQWQITREQDVQVFKKR